MARLAFASAKRMALDLMDRSGGTDHHAVTAGITRLFMGDYGNRVFGLLREDLLTDPDAKTVLLTASLVNGHHGHTSSFL
jgi:hypothetical protein